MMDYKEMISALDGYFEGKDLRRGDALRIADAMKTLLAERDAAIADLTALGQDSGDSCNLCKHLPCMDETGNGHCLGFVWRGPQNEDKED